MSSENRKVYINIPFFIPIMTERALNLDKLLEGDSTFRERRDQEIEINRKFVGLFPQPAKKGWFIFKSLEYPKLTKEQIGETLAKNHLVKENADLEEAIDEALKRTYDVGRWYLRTENTSSYTFVELTNGTGQKVYEFQRTVYGPLP